jgi:hypothetical protein
VPSSSGFRESSKNSISAASLDFLRTDMPRKNAPSANASPPIDTPAPIPAFVPVLRPPEFVPLGALFVGVDRSLPLVVLETELPWRHCDGVGRLEAESDAGGSMGVGVGMDVEKTDALALDLPLTVPPAIENCSRV